MAPELHDKSTVYYSDKVDLWSIGVVFYMMLFGNKGPWDFRTLPELMQRINTDSGSNLKFGKNPISNAAKDLLVRPIEPSPKKRISWAEFFNHKLFSDHTGGEIDIRRSVFVRAAENRVQKEFEQNRAMKQGETKMVEPENIQIQKIEQHYAPQKANAQTDAELKFNLELIKKRFSHEKEKTISMCKGAVDCRNAAKLTKGEFATKLALASLGLVNCTLLITQ